MIVLNLQFANARIGFWGFTTLVPLPADVGIILIFVINTESTICQIAIWRTDLGRGLKREFYRRFETQNRKWQLLSSWEVRPSCAMLAVLEPLLTLVGSSKRTSGQAWCFLTPLLNAASCIQSWYFASFLQNSPTSKSRPLGLPYGGQKEWEKNKDSEALDFPQCAIIPSLWESSPLPSPYRLKMQFGKGKLEM